MKYVYQTLEDRDSDIDQLENEGPYKCRWENAWLGHGYYFWDTFINNAHWWAVEGRHYGDDYIICEAICDFNDSDCCDLVGNTLHIIQFQQCYDRMIAEGLVNETTTVSRMITFMRNEGIFNFDAIRVCGLKSRKVTSTFHFGVIFEHDKAHYLDLYPPYQICFYRRDSLNLRNYRVVHPEKYTEYDSDFLV
jgi:hypothetical protein